MKEKAFVVDTITNVNYWKILLLLTNYKEGFVVAENVYEILKDSKK